MKKYLLIFVIFLIASPGFSQVDFGIKFGASYSKSTIRPYYHYTDNALKAKWLPGYEAGIVMDVTISDIFFFEFDLVYTQINTLYNPDPNIHDPDKPSPGKVDMVTRVNMVQLPFVARFETYDKKVTSYFETGFYGGYTIDGSYSITAENGSVDKSGNIDFTSYRKGDFGFVIGGGFGTDFGKKASWKLNLRYLFSTFDMYKYPENTKAYVKSQTRRFSLTLIFLFL